MSTIEINHMIATYMGMDKSVSYHEDWNALIPAIKKLHNELKPHFFSHHVTVAILRNDIETAHKEVGEALSWSNQFRVDGKLPEPRY